MFSPLKSRRHARRTKPRRLFSAEPLESRMLLDASVVISEFMAINDSTVQDQDGDFSDWIELHNAGDMAADLTDWALTDDATNFDQWRFPSVSLAAGEYLVVFASGKNRAVAGAELHTNFRLSGGGEYLALVESDETTVAHEFAPNYPPQVADVAYGLDVVETTTVVLPSDAPTDILVPDAVTGPALGEQWRAAGYVLGSSGETWASGQLGVGYDTDGDYDALFGAGGDVETAMFGNNGSAYVRAAFDVSDPASVDSLALNVKYDDGFVAYLNGQEVARRNATVESTTVYDFDNPRITAASPFPGQPLAGQDGWTVVPSQAGTSTVRNDLLNATGGHITGNATYSVSGGQFGRINDADFSFPRIATDTIALEFTVRHNTTGFSHFALAYDDNGNGAIDFNETGPAMGVDNGFFFIREAAVATTHTASVESITTGAGQVWRARMEIDLAANNGQGSGSLFARQLYDGGDVSATTNMQPIPGLQDIALNIFNMAGEASDPATWDALFFRGNRGDSLDNLTVEIGGLTEDIGWDGVASVERSDVDAVTAETIDLGEHVNLLQSGENVLAIHGLNVDAADADFLIAPQVTTGEIAVLPGTARYLLSPTPGKPNDPTAGDVAPIISSAMHLPNVPLTAEDIVVTAMVTETVDPVASVTLTYHVMYGGETVLAMADDGFGADLVAGDGIYTGVIPSAAYQAGEMVRWKITAVDSAAASSTLPAFADAAKSPEYFGTVVADPAVNVDLPVFAWFTSNVAGATAGGARASVFYNGEFYDNVFVRRRGQSSNVGPKKNLKFDFNPGFRFRFDPAHARVDEINMNNAYFDKSYVRAPLGWETFRDAGAPHSISFPLRMQLNGQFDAVRIFVEQVDEDYLDRNGLDKDGALYKARQAGNFLQTGSTANITKHTRLDENNSDLQALVNGIHPALPQSERSRFVFDNVDIPSVVNYLAVMSIIHGNDHMAKNYYLYRDTDGTGEWEFLPWDLDLSSGKNFANTGAAGDQIFSDDLPGGHPFFGSSDYPRATGVTQWNGLIDAVLDTSEIREMFLRRLRTLMDDLLQPPGTPSDELKFEARIDELFAAMQTNVADDDAMWNEEWGTDYTFQQNLDRIKDEYLAVRRTHLFVTHGIDNAGAGVAGIPHQQASSPQIDFGVPDSDNVEVSGEIVFNPISGNQDEEYISLINPNATAVDISGWQLTGGVEYTFDAGTVIPAGGTLYVSPDVKAFRARATGPGGSQTLFVQGSYSGHISNRGETLNLLDDQGVQVATVSTPSMPSPNQQFLRVTELHYNPSGTGETTEFIELRNISSGSEAVTLDLTGVRITSGPSEAFDFSTSSVTSLAPGAFVLVVKDQAAIVAAYPSVDPATVAGVFVGSLSNGGETIKIEDADNSTIVEFKYEDGNDLGEEEWHPETDGDGFSLVVVDQSAPIDDWNVGAGWRSSSRIGGSPGAEDPAAQRADFNGDGVVDRSDAVVLAMGYGRASGARRTTGDANGDRMTTMHDVALLQSMLAAADSGPSPQAASSRLAEAVGDPAYREIDESPRPSLSARRAARRMVGDVGRSATLHAEPYAKFTGRSRADSRIGARASRPRSVDAIFSAVEFNPKP